MTNEKNAYLPSHGFETLMKVKRPELQKARPSQGEHQETGNQEPLKSGEVIEVLIDGKWEKMKWMGKSACSSRKPITSLLKNLAQSF